MTERPFSSLPIPLRNVEEIGNRLAILHLGELRFVGTPETLKAQFQSRTLEEAYLRCIDVEIIGTGMNR